MPTGMMRVLRPFGCRQANRSIDEFEEGDLVASDHPVVREVAEHFAPEADYRRELLRSAASNPAAHEAGAAFGTRTPAGPMRADTQVLHSDQSLLDWGERRRLPGFAPVDRDRLRFDKLVRGIATGDWKGAEHEQRAIAETPATAGGHLVPSPLAAQVIDRGAQRGPRHAGRRRHRADDELHPEDGAPHRRADPRVAY